VLSIMVGGGQGRLFDKVLPIFQAMGKTITHLGPLGAGGFTKLANQIIVGGQPDRARRGPDPGQEGGLDRSSP